MKQKTFYRIFSLSPDGSRHVVETQNPLQRIKAALSLGDIIYSIEEETEDINMKQYGSYTLNVKIGGKGGK